MSQLFISGGQRTGVSASTSVLPMNISLGLTGLISTVQGILMQFLQHHSLKASILQHSAFFLVQLSHPYITTGKTISLEEYEKMHLYSKGKLQKSHLQSYSISLDFCREILHVLAVTQLSALSPVVLPLMRRGTVLCTQACCIADSHLHVYLPFH